MSSSATALASLTASFPNVSVAIPAIHLGGSTVRPISRFDPASKKARSDTSYLSLIKWAHHAHRDFDERLARIRSCIQDLNICLPLRQIQQPTYISGRASEFVFAFRVKKLVFGRGLKLKEYNKGAFMAVGGNSDDDA